MKTYHGQYARGGKMRGISFEAEDLEDAIRIGADWGVGVTGEGSLAGSPASQSSHEEPAVYDLETARRILGNVSRHTIWKWLTLGRLERVPYCRRILITRESIQNFRSARE